MSSRRKDNLINIGTLINVATALMFAFIFVVGIILAIEFFVEPKPREVIVRGDTSCILDGE